MSDADEQNSDSEAGSEKPPDIDLKELYKSASLWLPEGFRAWTRDMLDSREARMRMPPEAVYALSDRARSAWCASKSYRSRKWRRKGKCVDKQVNTGTS